LLPAWAVSSTVTGQQTELGVKHDKLQQVKAEREARAMMGQQDVKVDTTDAGESSRSCFGFQWVMPFGANIHLICIQT
jgi:polyisoprenoid-binding protein YceI